MEKGRLLGKLGQFYQCNFSARLTAQQAKVSIKDAAAEVSIGLIQSSKRAALRRGIWFRALSRVERGILDLTAKYVACIRSSTLAKVVTAILQKLEFASESVVDRLARTVGLSLARKTSDLARRWGNRSASSWAVDAEFARYLAVIHLNSGRTLTV